MTLAMQTAQGVLLSLDDDIPLFTALAEVIGKAPAIAAAMTPPGTDASMLAALVANPASVQPAFNAVGLGADFATLTQAPGKLAGLLPAQYQGLLKTIGALHGQADASISWSVSAPAAPAAAAGQPYSLGFTGSATLTLNADDTWPGGAGGQLLSVRGEGKADVTGSATAPFAPGASLQVGGEATADLTLTYYFTADAGALYAAALAESLPNLADPFDLGSVWGALRNGNLQGMILKFTGALSAQVQAMLADAAKLGDGVTADIGATVAVSAKLGGVYTLSVLKTAAGFDVSMTRDPSDQIDLSGSVGVDVDLSAATKGLSATLTTLTDDWGAALGDIKPFLSPGTWLKQQAGGAFANAIGPLVDDPGLQAGLVSDVQTALGATPAPGGVADWLEGVVTSAIDRGSVLVSGDLNAAVGNVMGELAKALPVLSQAPMSADVQAAQARLTALVQQGVQQVDAGLKTAVQTALNTSVGALELALKSLGATIGPVFASLDDALAPVRQVLAKVDAQFHQLIDPVQKALAQKVTAKLTFDDSISSETTVVVAGSFSGDDAQAATVYAALATGRVQAVINVFDGQLAAGAFTLDAAKSSIVRLSKRQSQQGFEVSFLGLDLTWSDVWSGTAKSLTDGQGDIHVDAAANLASSFASTNSDRSVSFVQTAAIVRAKAVAAAGGAPALEIGVTATYQAKQLGRSSVDAFVQQLAAHGLVSPGCDGHALAQFDAWAGAAKTINGSIAGALRCSGAAIGQLLQLNQRSASPGNALNDAGKRAIVSASLDYVRRLNPSGIGDFGRGMRLYCENAQGAQNLDDEAAVLDAIQYLPDGWPTMSNLPGLTITVSGGGQLQDYVDFFEDVFLVQQIIDMVDLMGQVYLATPCSAGNQAGCWNQAQYSLAEKTIADDSRNWVNLWTPVADIFGPQISAWTVLFMRIMADLAGLQGAAAVMVTLTGTPAAASAAARTAAFG